MQLAVRTPVRAEFPVAPKVAEPPRPSFVEYGARRVLIVAGVMLAALLQTIDGTIVNVALPTLQGNLGASVDEATWVVTAYMIANIVVIPMTPFLQMRFGRKTYFLISIAGFTVASVACGMATSLDELILFRVIQGVFGGGLLATAQVVLRETFPPEHLGTSQALYALGAVLGPSIGPTLGGILTDNLSWQWVFDINLVPGIVAFVLLALTLREGVRKRSAVDTLGIALLIAFVSSLQYVVDQGQHDDWFSNTGICEATVVAIVSLAVFVWWELRTATPIVDLRVLAQRGVTAASLISIGIATSIYGVLLLMPQFTVGELGFTSTLAGLLIGIRALPIALLTMLVGRLVNGNKIDVRVFVGFGLTCVAVSSFWLAHQTTPDATVGTLSPPLMLAGIGIACIFSPTLVAALRSVKPPDAPKASAFVTLWTQLGGSIAAAGLVAFTDRREEFHQDVLAANVNLHNLPIADFLHQHSVGALYELVVSQASTYAYADSFFTMGVISVLAIPLVLLLKPKKMPAR